MHNNEQRVALGNRKMDTLLQLRPFLLHCTVHKLIGTKTLCAENRNTSPGPGKTTSLESQKIYINTSRKFQIGLNDSGKWFIGT